MKKANAPFLLLLPLLLSGCSISFGPGVSDSLVELPSSPESQTSESKSQASESKDGISASEGSSTEESGENSSEDSPSSQEAPSSETEPDEKGTNVFYDGGFASGGEDSSASNPGKFYYWYGRDYGLGGEVHGFAHAQGEFSFAYHASMNWYSVQLFYQAPYAESGDAFRLEFDFLSDVDGKITINGDVVSATSNVWSHYEKDIVTSKNDQGHLSTFSIQLGAYEGNSVLSGSMFRFKTPKIYSLDPYSKVVFKDGNSVKKEIQVKNGKTVSSPADPEAPSGRYFAGWYDGPVKWEPSMAISSPRVFSSRFEEGKQPESSYVPQGYSLSWSDEFEGASLDSASWECQLGVGQDVGLWEWGNQEKQYYKKENATVSDGKLVIEAKKETTPYGNTSYAYSSARIRSKGKVHFAHGYVEAKISLPSGQGLWPAFWMLPENNFEGKGWPYSGEIDIMEARGRLPYESTSALHYSNDGSSGHAYQTGKRSLFDPITSFHVYSLLWEESQMVFSVDGIPHLRVPSSTWMDAYGGHDPFGQDFHILLNLAVGGSFDGGLLPDASFSSASMKIDYVRVYQK